MPGQGSKLTWIFHQTGATSRYPWPKSQFSRFFCLCTSEKRKGNEGRTIYSCWGLKKNINTRYHFPCKRTKSENKTQVKKHIKARKLLFRFCYKIKHIYDQFGNSHHLATGNEPWEKKKKSNDKEKWNANAQLINEDKWIMKTILVICWTRNKSITMDEEIWLLQFKWTEVLYEVAFIIHKTANILMLSRNVIALVNWHGKTTWHGSLLFIFQNK